MKAYRLEAHGKLSRGRLVDMEAGSLTPGDTLIRVLWSGINYKDALAGLGKAPIVIRLPVNCGIEAVGEVVRSDSGDLVPGDIVIAHGMGLGVDRDGGLAEMVRADADWLVPLPPGLDPLESASLGVAGFSAALAVDRLETLGLEPGAGPVAVTGSTGGVGAHAVAMLAGRGYEVVAVSSKPDAGDMLRDLGAADVILPPEPSDRMLEKSRWAGAIDSLGAGALSWLLRSAAPGATIASIGNAAGNDLKTTVIPFILRGITLCGINANAAPALRRRIWSRMAGDLRPVAPSANTRVIAPGEIDSAMERMIAGRSMGRTVVSFGDARP